MLVGTLGGAGRAGVDGHDSRAVLLAGLGHEVPVVVTRGEHVGPPHDDELGVDDVLGVEADGEAFGGEGVAGLAADAPLEPARPHRMEEPAERVVLYHAQRPEVVEGHERFCAVLGGYGVELVCDRVDRLVPGDALEGARSLRAAAAQGVQQAVRRVGALLVVLDLGAQHPPGEGVLLGACHLDDPPVLDMGHPATRVLAVEGTATLDQLGHGSPTLELGSRRPRRPRPCCRPFGRPRVDGLARPRRAPDFACAPRLRRAARYTPGPALSPGPPSTVPQGVRTSNETASSTPRRGPVASAARRRKVSVSGGSSRWSR